MTRSMDALEIAWSDAQKRIRAVQFTLLGSEPTQVVVGIAQRTCVVDALGQRERLVANEMRAFRIG